MHLWQHLGSEWDRALAGDALGAAAAARLLADDTTSADERAVLLAFSAFCELTLCNYAQGAHTAAIAAAQKPAGQLAAFYVDSMRLLAAAMGDQDVATAQQAPDFDEVLRRAGVAQQLGVDAALAIHPLIESAMATGRFALVSDLVTAHPAVRGSSEQVPTWLRLQLVRSLLFRGELDAVSAECAELERSGEFARYPQAGMLANALLCYTAAQRADRDEMDARSALVLAEARRVATYVQVGSCLLVSWSFAAIGQVQRAAALLLASAGGPGLARIKAWDRAFGYDLLVDAALRRNDLETARLMAARAAPLGRFEVAAAAVQRALSRLAVAEGDTVEALDRALRSAEHDSASGAQIDELRSRVLVAGALIAAGAHDEAMANLAATARDADRLGAGAVRLHAARELRTLSDRRGGWESLTDRERQIAALTAEGHSNRTIANTLFISERTVQSHVSHALRALGVGSRSGIPAIVTTAPGTDAPPLTQRQYQVAGLVAEGLTNATIAGRLGISPKTVEKHLAGIFERWGVRSRTSIASLVVSETLRSAG